MLVQFESSHSRSHFSQDRVAVKTMNIKNQLFLLAIIIVILSQICSAIKYNISLAELETCEVYYLDDTSSQFKESFEVNSIKNNLKKDNERLHLKFYLMASDTSNILLTQHPYCRDHCYQIVLSSEDVAIWRYYPRFLATHKPSPNMLSTFDPMPVEIIQTNEGELILNVPGYAEPLMKYLDPNPVDIKYFRFGSNLKTPAKWFYNCEFNENSNKESEKICDCGVKNISSINSGATAEIKQEDQLLTSKLSSTDSSMIKLMDSFLSRTVPLNRHNSFCNGLVPTLNTFDDNQVLEFQQGVIEQMKKIKNKNTRTTTEKPIPMIDVRMGN